MYIGGNARKAEVAAKEGRKDNVRVAEHRRQMAAAANAEMQEWAKTLTPAQRKLLGIK